MSDPQAPGGEETADPVYADQRDFYKVEQWTPDGIHIVRLMYAGNRLDKAHLVFVSFVDEHPDANVTIRQWMRVIEKWPKPR